MSLSREAPPETAARPAESSPSLLPRRISPAAIAAYRVCPRRVWFSHVAKVPRRERPSPTLVVGNAVHAALEKFFGVRPDRRDLDVLHLCLRSVWAQHRKPDSFLTRDEERDYGQTALALLTSFHEQFDTSSVPLARERWVSTRLPNGVELYTRVDRLDGEIHPDTKAPLDVVDYKTGRYVVESQDLPDEPAAQTHVLAVQDEYGRDVRAVRLLYLASGEESRWQPEAEDVDATREALLAVTWEMYRDREFEPRPGPHCANCPFAHVCPDAGRVEVDELVITEDVEF